MERNGKEKQEGVCRYQPPGQNGRYIPITRSMPTQLLPRLSLIDSSFQERLYMEAYKLERDYEGRGDEAETPAPIALITFVPPCIQSTRGRYDYLPQSPHLA